jgi:Cu/Ag efflux pump CusA
MGESIVSAALSGARQRLRPILMTSFAFIFGLFPLWNALGAGAAARRLIGTVTITGMIFSSGFAIFLVPMLFVIVQRLANRRRGKTSGLAPVTPSEPRRRSEETTARTIGAAE